MPTFDWVNPTPRDKILNSKPLTDVCMTVFRTSITDLQNIDRFQDYLATWLPYHWVLGFPTYCNCFHELLADDSNEDTVQSYINSLYKPDQDKFLFIMMPIKDGMGDDRQNLRVMRTTRWTLKRTNMTRQLWMMLWT